MSAPDEAGRRMLMPAAAGLSSVSVIVVNYHAGSCLLDCVRSLLSQCGEVVIVDNSASDAADSSVQNVREIYRGDARVLLLPQLTNLGFAGACNIGVGAARGDWLLFLNPDCVLHEHAVSELLKALHAAPDAGMAGALLLNPDGSEQAGGRRAVPTPWRSFVRAFGLVRFEKRYPRLFSTYDLHALPLPMGPEPVEAISGACMLVRKSALEDVGLLDEGYFMHCEDIDWCMRFRAAGWQVLFVPDARVVHAKGACSQARPVFVEWHKHKGMVRFYRRHFRHQYPGVLMLLVMLGVWARFLMVAGASLLRGVLSRFRAGRASG
ncbi:glycosyltransferase family 2 protein [Uliginosibacterium sp. 31-16]|uniref:glycosyltransferase family 2 protein n=1 Tax=Uliginosibacterium sp. 31-16 TaxID=3068315 RepID=UPI00273EDE31|nr:glycosyltransferase family 2 protein [Uliginosibacterium sp. 31-16]MDP5238442.1 glycosyltransferase family 2 protein [Uliginosibacterium sp. 31-16]